MNTVKKRLCALTLALMMVLSLTGCGAAGTVTLEEAGQEIGLANEKMSQYLADEPGKALHYASGTGEKSYPNAIILSWTLDGAEAEFYRVKVSENEELSDARVWEVTEPTLELYNC